MQPLNRAVAEPAALADLILTEQIWAISSAIFSEIFSEAEEAAEANNGPMRGANLRAAVRITFEEAVFGCEKETGADTER